MLDDLCKRVHEPSWVSLRSQRISSILKSRIEFLSKGFFSSYFSLFDSSTSEPISKV